MEKTAFIFLLLTIGILPSCKKDLNTFTVNTFTLGVDVQSSFDQDRVQVFIDGQEVINKRLQTNYSLGVCFVDGQITTTKNEGNHKIKIIVNNAATKTETFSLNNNLYIGINYNRQTNEISIIYSNQRFIYD